MAAVLGTGSQQPLPRVQDYPAGKSKIKSQVKLRLNTHNKKLFKTRLLEAAKEPPDFAGHYKIAGWGCGSVCAGGALIDLKNGDIFPLPFAGNGRDSEYWIFAGGPMDKKYIEYQVKSRLLVIRRLESDDHAPDDFYFLWNGRNFRQIRHITAAKLSRVSR